MPAALAVFLLGLLTLLGTVVTVLVAPLTPRDSVPLCCRRRVDAFAVLARPTLLVEVAVLVVGVVLLVVG